MKVTFEIKSNIILNKVKKSFTGHPGNFPFCGACDRKQFFKVGLIYKLHDTDSHNQVISHVSQVITFNLQCGYIYVVYLLQCLLSIYVICDQ